MTLFSALPAALLVVAIAKLEAITVFRRLTAVAGFLILIWFMLPLTFEGEIVARLGRLSFYREGIELSARISMKSVSIVLVFVALVATMPVHTLGHALYSFRLPAKLVFLLLITYRYIFVISGEYGRMRTAMRVRCFKSKTTIHSFKSIAYLIGMLFVRASLRAERIDQAMRLRGFNGRFYSLEDFEAYKRPPWIIAGLSLISALLMYLEWIHR
jgi:cobalt/nickel transport system permease protein